MRREVSQKKDPLRDDKKKDPLYQDVITKIYHSNKDTIRKVLSEINNILQSIDSYYGNYYEKYIKKDDIPFIKFFYDHKDSKKFLGNIEVDIKDLFTSLSNYDNQKNLTQYVWLLWLRICDYGSSFIDRRKKRDLTNEKTVYLKQVTLMLILYILGVPLSNRVPNDALKEWAKKNNISYEFVKEMIETMSTFTGATESMLDEIVGNKIFDELGLKKIINVSEEFPIERSETTLLLRV